MYAKKGRYGAFVQLGEVTDDEPKPKRMSLPKGVELTDVDLPLALSLLSLPRELGHHPEDNEKIVASIGRYGPYVAHKRTFASLKAEDDVLTIDLRACVNTHRSKSDARS